MIYINYNVKYKHDMYASIYFARIHDFLTEQIHQERKECF